jgi:hypothetical protein
LNANDDQMVADYLQRLRAAAGILPADRADELIEEITSHIAEARAADPAASGDSPSVRNILERLGDPADIVRTAADPAFGDLAGRRPPYDALGGHPAVGYPAAGGNPAAALPPQAGRGAGAHEIITVVLLLVGGIVVPVIGWVVGVVLLWSSPRWQTKDKLLGTLVWPGGLAAPFGLLALGGLFAASTSIAQTCGGMLNSAAATPISVSAVTSGGQHVVQHLALASCTSTGATTSWPVIVLIVILLVLAIGGPIFTAIRLLRRAGRPAAEPVVDAATLLTV